MHKKQHEAEFGVRAAPLAKAIKSIRKRLGKNTTEFAQMLGINQATISRHEAGKSMPGFITLGRLLALAEEAEKEPLQARLEELVGPEDFRHIMDQLYSFGGLGLPSFAGEALRTGKPNLVWLAELSGAILRRGKEIDSAVPGILALWLQTDSRDPVVIEQFRTAEKFLKVALLGGVRGALHATSVPDT
jgi:transcriptional regulator with XRE-family HTH domain